jgi:hypothetical protein
MHNHSITLDVDDDVLSFEESLMLRVGRLKEEVTQNFMTIAEETLNYGRRQLQINKQANFRIVNGHFTSLRWSCSPSEGINCEVLQLGARSWQTGKLKIYVDLGFSPLLEQFQYIEDKQIDEELRKKNIEKSELFDVKVILEFMPNLPEIPEAVTSKPGEFGLAESALDGIRRLIT